MVKEKIYFFILTFFVLTNLASADNLKKSITPYMCNNADAVILAKVLRVQQVNLERVPSEGIVTSVGKNNLVKVINAYKGALDNSYIEILTQGGTLPEGIEITLTGQPEFNRNEKVILFLKRRTHKPWSYEVFEKANGKILIENDEQLKEAEKLLDLYIK